MKRHSKSELASVSRSELLQELKLVARQGRLGQHLAACPAEKLCERWLLIVALNEQVLPAAPDPPPRPGPGPGPGRPDPDPCPSAPH